MNIRSALRSLRRFRPPLCAATALALAGVVGCADPDPADAPADATPAPLADADVPLDQRLARLLGVVAADSMEGREAGTEGERRARDFLVAELERYGVEPAGDDGYLQRVPLVQMTTPDGRARWTLPGDGVDPDTFPAERRRDAWNVLGMVPGADPELADEVVVVGAHYDHEGIGRPVDGDSIYNGADDDGSGTVAALEIGRALVRGEAPGRSVLIGLFTAEEIGVLGARWFLQEPTVELDRIVADLQIEMIGRPDSLSGGRGHGWLTGYELSTMGDLLADQGSPIVPDARPEQRFFFRSDNVPFARLGIPAHTLSSYDMHEDYHTPDDEVERVDPAHMAELVEAATAMVRALASGPAPSWHQGSEAVQRLGLRGPFPVVCGPESSGTALFVEGPTPRAWLTLDGQRRLLPQVEATSGARFEDDGVLLWLRGAEATVQLEGGDPRTCTLEDPAVSG